MNDFPELVLKARADRSQDRNSSSLYRLAVRSTSTATSAIRGAWCAGQATHQGRRPYSASLAYGLRVQRMAPCDSFASTNS
jgi:hypothetical protein